MKAPTTIPRKIGSAREGRGLRQATGGGGGQGERRASMTAGVFRGALIGHCSRTPPPRGIWGPGQLPADPHTPPHPHIRKRNPQENNETAEKGGPHSEANFRSTNFFWASDPPPPPPTHAGLSSTPQKQKTKRRRPAVRSDPPQRARRPLIAVGHRPTGVGWPRQRKGE